MLRRDAGLIYTPGRRCHLIGSRKWRPIFHDSITPRWRPLRMRTGVLVGGLIRGLLKRWISLSGGWGGGGNAQLLSVPYCAVKCVSLHKQHTEPSSFITEALLCSPKHPDRHSPGTSSDTPLIGHSVRWNAPTVGYLHACCYCRRALSSLSTRLQPRSWFTRRPTYRASHVHCSHSGQQSLSSPSPFSCFADVIGSLIK